MAFAEVSRPIDCRLYSNGAADTVPNCARIGSGCGVEKRRRRSRRSNSLKTRKPNSWRAFSGIRDGLRRLRRRSRVPAGEYDLSPPRIVDRTAEDANRFLIG